MTPVSTDEQNKLIQIVFGFVSNELTVQLELCMCISVCQVFVVAVGISFHSY